MDLDSTQKLLIITAPSGSGKTTIVNYLLTALPSISFSISACTRQPRGNEVDGVNYYFLSIEDFTHKIANHEFAEFEMVYEGKYYGTLKSELNRIWSENKFPLVDIDVQGALRLKKHYKENSLSIFIKAPSIEELERRLRARGTETEISIKERVEKASEELEYASTFDHIIVNDDLTKAQEEVENLIKNFIYS
jgi:guanylate kinase